ncbi:MAG: RluA family pseudouridine synthase, partial [Myxococcota bacterium]|nr:RluA family pseudouridine synthase [Myxococcota bacterium]
ERAYRREQLRQAEHDGKELQMLDHQSHDDSREIRRIKSMIRGETESFKEEIRRRRRDQSRLKKERAQIARCLQETLRESFLWETILHMQPGEFPDSYRGFLLVRLFAAVARHGLEHVEFSIVGDAEKDISEALQTIENEAQELQQLSDKALSHLCALTKPELRNSWLPPLEIVYQDQWFVVVNKPSGLLSVPGRKWPEQDSVITRVVLHFPYASGPLSVHRIDQATSGLQIVALNAQAHRELSMLFQAKRVKKTYFAEVEGEVPENSGIINLPLKPHYLDRIRQMVDVESGKKAVTNYQVIRRAENRTRLSLEPVTGRTHQLRVHCADPNGLGRPILGDKIYGSSEETESMRLHAGRVQFTHPFTGKEVDVSCGPPF